MSRMFLAAMALSSAFAVTAQASFQQKIIYGKDDRLEVFATPEALYRDLADGTVAMIPNAALSDNGAGVVTIAGQTYGNVYGLCKDEPFFSQPSSAMCSGFLIAPDVVVTAGHCIQSSDCAENSFVFGFRMQGPTTVASQVPASNVYKCKEVIARELTRAQDYAVVRLDRPAAGHKMVSMARGDAAVGDSLVVIGHPAGLPTKIAAGSKVRSVSTGYFSANLDTYGGNSGSAVFNAQTGEVVGILVRGGTDFAYDRANACTRSNYVGDDAGRGEDVTQISYVLKAIGQ